MQNSLTQKATTFLYKDDLYLVDYKLKDGRVLTYRFTPNTAVDGLWCNPFVSSFNSTDITTDVVQLRFRKLHYGGKQGKLKIQFVLNNIDSTNNYVRPFGISTKNKIKTILSIKQDFETQSEIWFEPENDGFESNQSNKIKTDQYSFTHRYSLDSIWSQIDSGINSIQIQAQTLYKIDGEKSDIIIEVKNSQNDFWKSTRLPKSHDWNYTYVPKTINREEHATGELLIYCWNKDKNPLLIDNFELRIVQKY